MTHPTDFLLLQARLADPAVFEAACAAAVAAWPGGRMQRMARSSETGEAYGYLALPARLSLDAQATAPVLQAFAQALPADATPRVSRLERAFGVAGASAGAEPHFHYVVEMDPEEGWRDELFSWYDTEHMPGLASVPGAIRATRLLNHDHGPLSLACYDLVATETLGSPPWLAVRASDWSSRVRPHFTNTRRTMFQTLAGARTD